LNGKGVGKSGSFPEAEVLKPIGFKEQSDVKFPALRPFDELRVFDIARRKVTILKQLYMR